MVRLAPYLVEALCELTRAVRDKTHSQNEVGGLLFGSGDDGVITVEALKTFKDSGPRSDLARRERMEKAFQAAAAQAVADPEFSSYKLLGWFSLRGSGGLIHADADFHNHHFKSSDDVALLVWREGDTQITAELYSAPDSGKLTTEDYRWSSVRLSTELRRVSQPIDLVMRVKLNEDSYLRAYATSDKEDRRDEWKKIATAAKRSLLSLLPGGNPAVTNYLGDNVVRTEPKRAIAPPAKPAFDSKVLFRQTEPIAPPPVPYVPPRAIPSAAIAPRPAISAPDNSRAISVRPPIPEVSGLPMVINRQKPPRRTSWLVVAGVFIVCSAITFGVLALKGLGSDSGKLSQIMRVIFPGSDLDLRAEGRGDRLLVTWNRKNPVVESSSMALLTVADGPRHFEKRLDPAQVAEGSVLYRPITGDVTFELKVFGVDQSNIAVDKYRVVDASTPVAASAGNPTEVTNTPSTPSTDSNDTSAHRVPPGSSQPVTSQAASLPPPPAESTVLKPVAENKSKVPAPQAKEPELATKPTPTVISQLPASQPQAQPAVVKPMAQTPPSEPPAPPPQQARVNSPARQESRPSPQPTQPVQTSPTAIHAWDPALPENKPTPPRQDVVPATAAEAAPPFVGPKVLLQVMPDTRTISPGFVTELTRVKVEVNIDEKGHVKGARVLDNPKPQLAAAAVAAARQWTFQPATLQGQKVPSNHTLIFEFTPDRASR